MEQTQRCNYSNNFFLVLVNCNCDNKILPIVDSDHVMLYTVITAALTTQFAVELPFSQGASTVLWLS